MKENSNTVLANVKWMSKKDRKSFFITQLIYTVRNVALSVRNTERKCMFHVRGAAVAAVELSQSQGNKELPGEFILNYQDYFS